jgi:hypothetical protein
MSFDNNLSDYLDGQAYGHEADGYANDGSTESAAPAAPAPRVTANAQVSPLRVGLGEFDARQLCFARPMARLAWAFLATTAEGRTMDALGVLSVYQSMFNSQRGSIAPGLSDAARARLPAALPETAWTEDMRLSMQIVLSSVTGGVAARNAALLAMPSSVAAIPSWFALARSAFDESGLRTYLEVPRIGGETVAASVLAAVRDDVDACLSPAPPPPGPVTIGPPTGLSPCPPGTVRVGGRCQSVVVTPGGPPSQNRGGGAGSGSGGGSSGSGGLLVVLALLAAGAYWVYRKDSKPSQRDEE